MKRFYLLIILLLFVTVGFSQESIDDKVATVKELRNMGLTDAQIRQLYEKFKDKFNNAPNVSQDKSVSSDSSKQDVNNLKQKTDSSISKNGNPVISNNPDSNLTRKEKLPPGVIYGQDLFRNNNIKYYSKANEINAPDSYVIGVGDELTIAIWGYSDYNETFKVSENGFITSKLVGRVYLKGLPFGSAKELMKKKFSKVTDLNNSQSDFTLSYSKVISINIVGEVFYPGSYSIPSINSAFNALVAAEGPSQIGSVRNIYLKRGDKIIDTLDVYKFLMNPETAQDIYLQNNDFIIVPVAKKVITVTGEVKRPNTYELKDNENLNDLVKYAGGINSKGISTNIQVYRYTKTHQILIDVNLDSLQKIQMDFELSDADSVHIGKIGAGVETKVSIEGAVRVPGEYEFKKGDKILDVIYRAQGLTANAYPSRAYVYRQKDNLDKIVLTLNLKNILDNPTSIENLSLENKDHIKILSKEDFTDSLSVIVYGAVRKPVTIPYGTGLSLRDALLFSGGLKPGAAPNQVEVSRVVDYTTNNQLSPIKTIVKTLNIGQDLNGSEEAAQFKLEPFDEVFVRNNPDFITPKNIVLKGEVKYPGKYSLLRKDETASELIARAGGLTQYAFLDGVKMRRSLDSSGFVYLNLDKAIRRPHSRYDQILVEGDSIYIPKTIDLVQIAGAIGNVYENTINCPYFGKRAGYYIRNFGGGFRKTSSRRNTLVIHPNGIMRRTFSLGFHIYPRVKKGSKIYVEYKIKKIKAEQKQIDWNSFIEKTTIKLTGIFTLLILANTFAKK